MTKFQLLQLKAEKVLYLKETDPSHTLAFK